MSTSPIDSRLDPHTLKAGDKIRMRGPDGGEREGTFFGSLLGAFIAEAPVEHLKVSDDLTVVRQGPLYRFEGAGAGALSIGAQTLLITAFDAGADVAKDYLKGFSAGSDHPLYDDPSLTLNDLRAMAQRGQAPLPEEPTAADELLNILQRHIQPKFDHHVAAGEAYFGSDKDDAIAAAAGTSISGNEGNDWIDGREKLKADGGTGNDVIEAYENAALSGGNGDDRLTAYSHSTLAGGTGDDHLAAYDHARISGGDGHDYISAYGHAAVDGGSGNDYITVYGQSTAEGGDGHDFIAADDHGVLSGGAGNDIIRARNSATISGGQGDDAIQAGRDAVIHFNRGDGLDTIAGQGGTAGLKLAELTGHRPADPLSSARIMLGPDIGPGDLTITREGADLRIQVAGSADAIVIRNVEQRGAPSLVFADGSVVSGDALRTQAGTQESAAE
jgi:hypothetical protein